MLKSKTNPIQRIAVRVVCLALGGAVLFATGCSTIADKALYPAPKVSYETGGKLKWIKTADGERLAMLHGTAPANRFTVLYSHGNGEDLGMIAGRLTDYLNNGYNVMAYDYRGYGHSSGTPSEDGLYRDIDAAYAFLTGEAGVAPGNIVLIGYSLGSGPSVDLASRKPVGALVLLAPFSSAFDVAVPGSGWLPGNRYPNERKISGVDCPVLVVHGDKDTSILPKLGRRVHDAANPPKQFLLLPGVNHFGVERQGKHAYWVGLAAFLQSHVHAQPASPR